ncbi:hypothetical protein WJU16_01565 [Chitinophaga pollutisoli]|uniref:Uncharacterized protein n=1 Tax=Chitinophaga pollutisoli TaxID=3133966 RepID=A0ABZ2YQC3_9BACT
MNTLTDPAFIRYKYTSYLVLAGTFLLVVVFLLKTGTIGDASRVSPTDTTAAVLSSATR